MEVVLKCSESMVGWWWHVHHGGQHQTGGLRWEDRQWRVGLAGFCSNFVDTVGLHSTDVKIRIVAAISEGRGTSTTRGGSAPLTGVHLHNMHVAFLKTEIINGVWTTKKTKSAVMNCEDITVPSCKSHLALASSCIPRLSVMIHTELERNANCSYHP